MNNSTFIVILFCVIYFTIIQYTILCFDSTFINFYNIPSTLEFIKSYKGLNIPTNRLFSERRFELEPRSKCTHFAVRY